jgi:serine/threonine protein kinase
MRHASEGHVGPYQILDLLGSGGMGVVYRAHDRRLGRQVAVKVLLPEVIADADALVRFEREMRAVAALSHPNILAIYDFQRDGESVYAVMELLTGGTLRDRLRSGPMPPRKAIDIAIQIARGLAAAHEHGFVHRDLKPENIAFTKDGRVKILDFGLARQGIANGDPDGDSPTRLQHTVPGLILGTVGYMSPEQVRGLDIDHRSDLFAFGALLYEMLTGRHAFDRHTPADTMSAILNDDVSDFHESGVNVPLALDRVVRRCLEKHPEERFHSARDLAFALENTTGSGGHMQPSADGESRTRRLGRAALLVGAGAALALLVSYQLPATQPQFELSPFTHSTLDSAPSVSPDGSSVVYSSNRTGTPHVYRRTFGTGAERRLTRREEAERLPRYFGSDGSAVLLLRPNGSEHDAWRYSEDSAALDSRPLVTNVVEAVPSPDGLTIGFVRMDADAPADETAQSEPLKSLIGMKPTAGTGLERILLEKPDVEFGSLDWSPDGTRLAVVERSLVSPNPTAVVIVDVRSQQPVKFEAASNAPFGALTWADNDHLVVTEAQTTQVYVPGSPGRVVRMDVSDGTKELLFSNNDLFSVFGYLHGNARLDVTAAGSLAFDAIRVRQNLEERPVTNGPATAGHTLTRGTSLDRQPTYFPGRDAVVFTSNRSGNLDLWLVTSDGQEYQLTRETVHDWDPAFGEDGTLVWSAGPKGQREIWSGRISFEPDGPLLVGMESDPITEDGDAQNPSLTRDGFVVYRGSQDGKPALKKIRLDGNDDTVLYTGGIIGIPDVSPNGAYVLFREDNRARMEATIRVLDIKSGRLDPEFFITVPYTFDEFSADVNRGRARWNGNDAIMFVGQGESGHIGIFEQAFTPGRASSAPWRLIVPSEPDRLTESFDVSPDGTKIVVSFGTYERNIWIADSIPGILARPAAGR